MCGLVKRAVTVLLLHVFLLVIKKSDLAARHHLALRDFRFSTLTSILVREHCTVVGLQVLHVTSSHLIPPHVPATLSIHPTSHPCYTLHSSHLTSLLHSPFIPPHIPATLSIHPTSHPCHTLHSSHLTSLPHSPFIPPHIPATLSIHPTSRPCYTLHPLTQHIKAIITAQSVTFLEARGPLMVDFVKELQAHLQTICLDQQDGGAEVLPYEFVVLETMLAKMVTRVTYLYIYI